MERYYNFGGEAIVAADAAGAPRRAGGQRAGGRSSRLAEGAARSRAARSADAALARAARAPPPISSSPPARRSCRPGRRASEDARGSNGAPTRIASIPARPGALPFAPPAGRRRGLCRRLSQLARRDSSGARDARAARPRTTRHLRAVHRRRPGAGGRAWPRRRGLDNVLFTGALPHDACRRRWPPRHIGVAPFDLAAHKPLALGFYWSPLKIFEYMAAGLPVVAPAAARIPALVGDRREGPLYDPPTRRRARGALAELGRGRLSSAPRLGAAARDRAIDARLSWDAHCRAPGRPCSRACVELEP